MSKIQIRAIYLKHLRLDSRIQPRDGVDEATVETYAQAVRDGAKFPPAVVFYDGTDNWLAGGFTRYAAHERANKRHLECEVREGTRDEAWLFARGDNKHGKHLTVDEKNRVARELIQSPLTEGWSNRQIALHLGVSDPFIGRVKLRLAEEAVATRSSTNAADAFIDEGESRDAPFRFEFLVGDEVAGTTQHGDSILGVIAEIYPEDTDGCISAFVKGEGYGICFVELLALATGRYFGSIADLEPGHLVAWEFEGQTFYGRFIEHSSDLNRIHVSDFFDPSKQYEPKIADLGVRRWTSEDRKNALALHDERAAQSTAISSTNDFDYFDDDDFIDADESANVSTSPSPEDAKNQGESAMQGANVSTQTTPIEPQEVGHITADGALVIGEPAPDEPSESAPPVATSLDDLSDEAWVALLPLDKQLAAFPTQQAIFRADALTHRLLGKVAKPGAGSFIGKLRHQAHAAQRLAQSFTPQHGPLLILLMQLSRVSLPVDWKLCASCRGCGQFWMGRNGGQHLEAGTVTPDESNDLHNRATLVACDKCRGGYTLE